MALFTVENLTFSYPGQTARAIDSLSLTVPEGAFLVLCGPSGCGKSTLLRQLKPALAPHGTRQGRILFRDTPLDRVDQRTLAARIGFVQQSPENQIVTDKVWHELAFGLESLGVDTPTIRRRVAEMAAFFGIEDWFYRDVSQLSGGQKQLLNLASVMAMQPDVLILDEPTSQLDPIAASDFLAVLGKINRELGTAVVLTEHRLEEAFPLATAVAVMDRGQLLCTGTPYDVGRRLKALGHRMFLAMPAAMRVWASVETEAPCPVTVREGRDFLRSYAAEHPLVPLPREQTYPRRQPVLTVQGAWFRYEPDSPDEDFCARYAHRCALFFDGSVVTEASPRAFFSGNSFYTTAANRMARSLEPQAVTAEDVMAVCGGTVPAEPALPEDIPPLPEPREETPDWKPKKLPLWRKALAAVSGAGALAIFLYATGVTDLSAAVGKGGLTALGWQQLRLYLVFCGLLLVLALSIGRRTKPLDLVQVPAEKRRLSRRTAAAAVSILLLIPVTLFVGVYYLDNRQYGLMSVLVLLECMAPFFLVFEGRRPQARELVVIAVLCAISVAGRAAFFMLPQFKPVMAMTIISGVALGGESGFLVGALSMLVSNMLFSQGVWTPWQMFSMGIIGFFAGVLFRKGLLRRTLGSMCTFGAFCAIVIYGGIMNPASVLMWAGAESLTWKTLLTYYVTGFPVDCVHAAATVFFLWVAAEPMLEKLDRIKEKYGLLT